MTGLSSSRLFILTTAPLYAMGYAIGGWAIVRATLGA